MDFMGPKHVHFQLEAAIFLEGQEISYGYRVTVLPGSLKVLGNKGIDRCQGEKN